MNNLIPISKASFYLEDREAISRINNLYCYIRRFSDELNPNELEIEKNEEEPETISEVYLSGLFRIDPDYVEEYFLTELTDESFNPNIKLVDGTVNGERILDCNRVFRTSVYRGDIYVTLEDIEELSKRFGIPKTKYFKERYIKSLEEILKEYDPDDHQLFYPNDEIEADEIANYFFDPDDRKTQSNHGKNVPNDDVHGNTRKNAVIRQQIFACTLAMIFSDSNKGRNKSGKFQATNLTSDLELYAKHFWKSGSPPLSTSTLEAMFRNILQYTPENLEKRPTREPDF